MAKNSTFGEHEDAGENVPGIWEARSKTEDCEIGRLLLSAVDSLKREKQGSDVSVSNLKLRASLVALRDSPLLQPEGRQSWRASTEPSYKDKQDFHVGWILSLGKHPMPKTGPW